MDQENVPQGTPELPEKEESLTDRLHHGLEERFGTDWRRAVTLEVQPKDFYWVVYLACLGLEQRRKEFRALPYVERDTGMAASLGSWECDLEDLVDQVLKAPVVPPKPEKKRRK